jgi:hypothetical protein
LINEYIILTIYFLVKHKGGADLLKQEKQEKQEQQQKKQFEELSKQLERALKLKIYDLCLKVLDSEETESKVKKLIDYTEFLSPGTKKLIQQTIEKNLKGEEKEPESPKHKRKKNKKRKE